VQGTDRYIKGYNISFAAEESSILDSLTVGNQTGLLGTRMAITTRADGNGGTNLFIFFQMIGDDVTVMTRNLAGGVWNLTSLPIPELY
jgi:hypothetical protein